jgi:hypothetical protein
MVAMMLYENESEKRQHLSAIHVLASTFGIAEESVRQLYEHELQSLIGQARVRDFLSVLVIRKLKERITHGL